MTSAREVAPTNVPRPPRSPYSWGLVETVTALLREHADGDAFRVLDLRGALAPAGTHLVAEVGSPGVIDAGTSERGRRIRAAVDALPFRSGRFDLVVATDAFDPVAKDARAGFVEQLVRLEARFLVINQRVHHGPGLEAERRLSWMLSGTPGAGAELLRAHLASDVPSQGEIEGVLRALGATFTSIPDGRAVLRLLAALEDSPRLDASSERDVLASLDLLVRSGEIYEACCRRVYLVARDDVDRASMEAVGRALQRHGGELAAGRGLGELIQALEDRAPRTAEGTEEEEAPAALAARLHRAEAKVEDLKAVLSGKREQVLEKDLAILKRDRLLREQDQLIERYRRRLGVRAAERMRRTVDTVLPYGTRRRAPVSVARTGGYLLRREGPLAFLQWVLSPWRWFPQLFRASLDPPVVVTRISLEGGLHGDRYQLWLLEREPTDEDLQRMRDASRDLAYRPKVSIVMPTYNSDLRWLKEAIDSVRLQVYENWQLCIADDGSPKREVRRFLRRMRRGDPRIDVVLSRRNQGIAGASQAALDLATGDYVALLDHDDILLPETLLEVVTLLNEQPELDYIYTDEDKLELDGVRVNPFFKPDWSPDLLLSFNYLTHLSVFRTELLRKIGGFRLGFDGSQDYDLLLRFTEATDRIAHIPKLLYSWRKAQGSAAGSETAKPFAYEAAKRAIAEAIERRGMEGVVSDGPSAGMYTLRYRIREEPQVSIIIPTRDRVDLLRRCVDSIREGTTYRAHEIMIVDNDSSDPETLEYLSAFEGPVVRHPGAFNFARIVNAAARESRGDMLLFLNNDTEVISPDWIEALVEHGQRPEVAAVGARLLYPDGQPQHEGVLIGVGNGLAAHINTQGYFGLGWVVRNVSAVTAACMLTRREVFWDLGGFEERLAVAYNDVDYCLRAREKGHLVVYTPHAELYHHEGASRGVGGLQPPEDAQLFRERWEGYRDPYYNPNLELDAPFRLPLKIDS